MEYLIAIGVGAFLVALVLQFAGARCPKCKTRIQVEDHSDPLGMKLKKNLSISLLRAPRRVTLNYVCPSCGHKMKRKITTT